MLRWVKTLKRRIETSGYGGRPITGVDLQPVKYGSLCMDGEGGGGYLCYYTHVVLTTTSRW